LQVDSNFMYLIIANRYQTIKATNPFFDFAKPNYNNNYKAHKV